MEIFLKRHFSYTGSHVLERLHTFKVSEQNFSTVERKSTSAETSLERLSFSLVSLSSSAVSKMYTRWHYSPLNCATSTLICIRPITASFLFLLITAYLCLLDS